jgi:hypothetical protein
MAEAKHYAMDVDLSMGHCKRETPIRTPIWIDIGSGIGENLSRQIPIWDPIWTPIGPHIGMVFRHDHCPYRSHIGNAYT